MAEKKRGFFITLEGPDGSGKSTQFKLLAERLKRDGFSVIETREPGGHPLAEKIRTLLLAQEETPPSAEAELLLFLAARAQHVRDVIQPALAKNQIVLCERFADSTYAYQVGGRQLSPRFVVAANRFATHGLKPRLTLLLDLPSSVGLQRAFSAKRGHDRMERESLAFARRVRQAYLALAAREPARIQVVRANRALARVSEEIYHIVAGRLASAGWRSHAVS